jgi:uncharacterized protein (TIGR02271 family)
MKNHDLVAFYNSRETAERVRDELLNAGFDRDDTKVYANEGGEPGSFWDSIKDAFGALDEEDRELYAEAGRRGASAVAVSLDDADSPPAQRAVAILQQHQPIDFNQQSGQRRTAGSSGSRATTSSAGHTPPRASTQHAQPSAKTEHAKGREAIPVVEEQVRIGKRRVAGGGVHIHSRVTERPVEQDVQLRQEHVKVDRHPIDRPLSAGDAGDAFRERTIEATETREEPVVKKEARVVEEVAVHKEADQRTERVRDTARRTDVSVEKIPPGAAAGDSYDEFVNEIAADTRYRGRDWDAMEPDVRRSFEHRYPDSRWDQAKDAVRRGYERRRTPA